MKDKIHKVTEPMKNELVLLKEVNKKLQDELTVMKSKQKEEQERDNESIIKRTPNYHGTF